MLGNILFKEIENVEAIYLMLQQDKLEDCVIATAKSCNLEDFVVAEFSFLNLDFYKYVVDKIFFDQLIFQLKEVIPLKLESF